MNATVKTVCRSKQVICRQRPGCREDYEQDDDGLEEGTQPFSTKGVLSDNMNLAKTDLQRLVAERPGKVRSYKMISVFEDRGHLWQYGSGPNFQGGLLTLCTCQCVLRAEKKKPDEWRRDRWWIAGFTSPKHCDRTWLFYLAQVGRVYETQADLWAALPDPIRRAKTTRRNPLGDVYQPDPDSDCSDPHDIAHYHPPMEGHSHHETANDDGWHKDIEFFHNGFKRYPVLLVAKPSLTFLWQTPRLYVDRHERNDTWDSVSALLLRLRSAR